MLVMSLQLAVTLALLGVGLLSLAVSRTPNRALPFHPHGWRLCGVSFTVHGASQLAQNLWGVWAMAAGVESGVMVRYIRWAPAFNHSRTFLWLAFFAILSWFLLRRDLPGRRQWAVAAAGLAAGLAIGAAMGRAEGPLIPKFHYGQVAIWDAVELGAMLVTLFVALLVDRLDRYLWALLAVFASMVALNVLWLAALTMINDSRVWSPPTWGMGAYRLVVVLLMLAIAGRRLVLAWRGVAVRSLLDRGKPGVPMLAG
jgi:hypothetical protein